ncbi:MAG: hypothetical protein AAGJ46_18335 [Planctomycetota bacterium]
MERFLRFFALATCGATLVWLTGCGSPAPSTPPAKSAVAAEMERRQAEKEAAKKQAAAAAEEAERAALAAEGPSEITKDDFKKGSKVKGRGYLSTVVRSGRRAGEDLQLMNIKHQLSIHGNAQGFPKSHEEFMKLVTQTWGMQLPELQEPYEYWYDAKTHDIVKRVKPSALAAEQVE